MLNSKLSDKTHFSWIWAYNSLNEVHIHELSDSCYFPHRFSRDRPRFTDTLDVIKFLCKDLWMLVFRKQVDNLKTNHRGVYVLTDNSFRPFARMSTEAGGQAVVRAQPVCFAASFIFMSSHPLVSFWNTPYVEGDCCSLLQVSCWSCC